MRSGICGLLSAGIIIMTSTGTSQEFDSGNFKRLDDIVTSGIKAKVFPGATLIVGKPGSVLWARAYGNRSYDANAKPMTIDTIFDMASCTKVIGTATAAMCLIEDGKLKLDDPVSKFIPEFASKGKDDVTLKDLMTHVSGLPSYVQYKKAEEMRKPGESSADALIRCIASLQPRSERGTSVTYSCLNMLTQARVNENVLGTRMDTFLKSRVYDRLGMTDTTYRLTDEQLSRTAPTTKKPDGTNYVGQVHDPLANYQTPAEHCPGNAGLFSTAGDVAKYCTMILREGQAGEPHVFKPETVREMTRVQTPPEIQNKRGLGWDIYPPGSSLSAPMADESTNAVIAHTGYTGTLLWIDKKSQTFVVFLTNRTMPNDKGEEGEGIGNVRREIVQHVLRSIPDYKEHYAKQAKEGKPEKRRRNRRS